MMKCYSTPNADLIRFQCNVCGFKTSFPMRELSREDWSCWRCASTVRFRAVIHALSVELFGKSMPICDFPHRPDLKGIGMSDWEGYATRLPLKFGYVNTFYHMEPFLDITSVDPARSEEYDFIISTDVYEHICPPISTAFENAYRLLKPGGVMIFTVPYVEGKTHEHFPNVREFRVGLEGEYWVLTGTSAEGVVEKFSNLTFHGGPGTVVEFRLFGREALEQDCRAAGFKLGKVYGEKTPEYGIVWNPYVPEDAPYRPLIYGLDTPPWALRRCEPASSNLPLKSAAQIVGTGF
jgi:SAM-dependent methyltransferase